MKRGATLLDVRMATDFAKERAAGAVNAPLFQLTAGDAAWVRAGFRNFGRFVCIYIYNT